MEQINQELLNELAEDMYESAILGQEFGSEFLFPIVKVDNMDIDCRVVFRKHYAFFTINSSIPINDDDGDEGTSNPCYFRKTLYDTTGIGEQATQEHIKNAIIDIYLTLGKLKFDNYTGSFNENGTTKQQERCKKLAMLFGNIENIKTNTDVCCVCHEPTVTTTKCGHYLCYVCWFQIIPVEVGCGCMDRPCPLCKADI